MTQAKSGSTRSVHLVLTNWKRPSNLPPIIKAFRGQVDRITLIDNSQHGEFEGVPIVNLFAPENETIEMVDDYWQVKGNGGPPIRFAPGLQASMDFDFTLFWDDDLLPPGGLVDSFLACSVDENVGEFGIIGRRFSDSGAYIRRNVKRKEDCLVEVNMCCRCHFMPSHLIHEIYAVREYLLTLGADRDALWRNDDLLITAMCVMTGRRSYLIPKSEKHQDLPAPFALPASMGGLDEFMKERNALSKLIWKNKSQLEKFR